MANEIGNKFNATFAQITQVGGAYENDMMDLLKQVDSDPVWGPSALKGEFFATSGTSETSGTSGSSGVDKVRDTSSLITETLGAITKLMDQVDKLAFGTSEPDVSDSSHPEGSLSVGTDGTITTPGGYKIEQTGQYGWKVTGPDSKTTEIWGDPHVKEGDGGNWDFKRDSTFVLGDGTRINVNTAPYNNMTVTKGLEIISGNDRVQVTDIDKGKGNVGKVTKDGYANVNSFGNKDVFVMGKESDDWSFKGKEIEGSNNGGDSFKLGKDLEAGVVGPLVQQNKANGGEGFYAKMYEQISKMFDAVMGAMGTDGNAPDLGKLELPSMPPESQSAFSKSNPGALDRLSKSFAAIGAMFEALSKILDLANSIPPRRTYQSV